MQLEEKKFLETAKKIIAGSVGDATLKLVNMQDAKEDAKK